MTTLYLPNFRPALAQLASGNNPQLATATAALEAWALNYSKISPGKWDKAPACWLAAAMCYPATDVERLRVNAEWFTVLFVWDDLLDVLDTTRNVMYKGRAAEEIQKIMTGVLTGSEGEMDGDGLAVADAYRSFWTHFCATSTPRMQKRYVETVLDYAEGALNQVRNREKGQISWSIEGFIANRRDTSACETIFAGVEYCMQIELPDEAYYHPIMQQMRDAANDIISWANDIYSFNKEQACGDHQNLVAIVAIEKDIPVQSAIAYVALMVQAAIDRYLDVRARFPSFGLEMDEVVAKYTWGLECVCTGVTFWHLECDLYFGAGFSDVKDSFAVELLPRHEDAVEPKQRLRYEAVPGADLGGGDKGRDVQFGVLECGS